MSKDSDVAAGIHQFDHLSSKGYTDVLARLMQLIKRQVFTLDTMPIAPKFTSAYALVALTCSFGAGMEIVELTLV